MKTKEIIVTAVFILLMLGLKAQDKYEFATVTYTQNGNNLSKYDISICKEGKFDKTNGQVSDGVASENTLPVLEILDKMSKENWEVLNSNIAMVGRCSSYIFFLRKKKS